MFQRGEMLSWILNHGNAFRMRSVDTANVNRPHMRFRSLWTTFSP